MLAEQFRSIAIHTGRMKELLGDPVLAAAIVCLKDEAPVEDVSGDAVESVRRLSWLSGYNNAIDLFLSLSEPLPVEPLEPEPTWGVQEPILKGTYKG